MELTKEEQLRRAFKKILEKYIVELLDDSSFIKDLTEELLSEVKTKTNLE